MCVSVSFCLSCQLNRFPRVDFSISLSNSVHESTSTKNDVSDISYTIWPPTSSTVNSSFPRIVASQPANFSIIANLSRRNENSQEKKIPTFNDASHQHRVVTSALHKPKDESWWLIVGSRTTSELLAIKRVTLQHSQTVIEIELILPAGITSGIRNEELVFYWMSDSYIGLDQEFHWKVEIETKQQQTIQQREGENHNHDQNQFNHNVIDKQQTTKTEDQWPTLKPNS